MGTQGGMTLAVLFLLLLLVADVLTVPISVELVSRQLPRAIADEHVEVRTLFSPTPIQLLGRDVQQRSNNGATKSTLSIAGSIASGKSIGRLTGPRPERDSVQDDHNGKRSELIKLLSKRAFWWDSSFWGGRRQRRHRKRSTGFAPFFATQLWKKMFNPLEDYRSLIFAGDSADDHMRRDTRFDLRKRTSYSSASFVELQPHARSLAETSTLDRVRKDDEHPLWKKYWYPTNSYRGGDADRGGDPDRGGGQRRRHLFGASSTTAQRNWYPTNSYGAQDGGGRRPRSLDQPPAVSMLRRDGEQRRSLGETSTSESASVQPRDKVPPSKRIWYGFNAFEGRRHRHHRRSPSQSTSTRPDPGKFLLKRFWYGLDFFRGRTSRSHRRSSVEASSLPPRQGDIAQPWWKRVYYPSASWHGGWRAHRRILSTGKLQT